MVCAITVSRSDFKAALELIAKVSRKRTAKAKDKALLTVIDGKLRIELFGIESRITFSGKWTTSVRVPGAVILRLAKVLPAADPLSIAVSDGKLRIDKFAIPCIVVEDSEDFAAEQHEVLPATPKTTVRHDEEAACIQLLFQINEILYSIILGASAFKEEIPALRKMLFRLEGMTPELRAELDAHASKLQEILAHRSQYRDDAFRSELAICCHQMVKIIQARLGFGSE